EKVEAADGDTRNTVPTMQGKREAVTDDQVVDPTIPQEVLEAQRQWDEISKLREAQNYGSSNTVQEKPTVEQNISLQEVLEHFKSVDTSEAMAKVRESYPVQSAPGFMLNVMHLIQRMTRYKFGRPRVKSKRLEREKMFLLCLTKIPFDHGNEV